MASELLPPVAVSTLEDIAMPYKNPEDRRKYQREYVKRWRIEHPEKYRKRMKKWRAVNYQRLKSNALIHYGGNPPRCACCGEQTSAFLTIDHLNGGGCAHRREMKKNGYGSIYQWLKNMNYPEGFRILCANCNTAIGILGVCPHQK